MNEKPSFSPSTPEEEISQFTPEEVTRVLFEVLRTASKKEAFFHDYFPEFYRIFPIQMPYSARFKLFFEGTEGIQGQSPDHVMAVLRNYVKDQEIPSKNFRKTVAQIARERNNPPRT